LRDLLPPGFIGVALLDTADAGLIEGAEMPHPFDSPEGVQRLRAWLTTADEGEYSYAHSATAAMPFLSEPGREELLGLAMKHPDIGVQIETAWAAAKLGQEEGLHRLAAFCRNINHSHTARRYLGELGREDLVPSEAKDADFEALASISTVMEWTNAKAVSEDQAKSITSFLLPNQGMGTGWLAKPEATRNGLWARLSKVTWTRVLSMVTVAETSRRLRKSFLA